MDMDSLVCKTGLRNTTKNEDFQLQKQNENGQFHKNERKHSNIGANHNKLYEITYIQISGFK